MIKQNELGSRINLYRDNILAMKFFRNGTTFLFAIYIFIIAVGLSNCNISKRPIMESGKEPHLFADTMSTRVFILRSYVDSVKLALNSNQFPDCLLNECLDEQEDYYCHTGSHLHSSLRNDIFESLTIDQLNRIKLISDSVVLSSLCDSANEYSPYQRVSNWMLLARYLSERK